VTWIRTLACWDQSDVVIHRAIVTTCQRCESETLINHRITPHMKVRHTITDVSLKISDLHSKIFIFVLVLGQIPEPSSSRVTSLKGIHHLTSVKSLHQLPMSSTSFKKSLGGSSSPSLSRSSNKGQKHSNGSLEKSKRTSKRLTCSEFSVEFTKCMREKYASSYWSIVGGFNKFQSEAYL
jgi:hypothetical protein